MQPPFEIVVQKLVELGFYKYIFPFFLSLAFLYALLKRSKLIGDSPMVNATLAMCISFIIVGFQHLAGISLETPFSSFFMHATVWIWIFAIGMMVASLFYPDLGRFLTEYFIERKSRLFYALIVIGILTFVTSGMYTVFTGMYKPIEPGAPPVPPFDVILTATALLIFVVILMIATAVVRGA